MKTRAGQKIRLTSVEELLGVVNEESAMDLEIAKIRPFKDHPFKVLDDEKMQDLMESIRINGILSPVLVRPIGNDTYEMVSGHRRMHAAMMLGMDTVPAIIREMTDDEAVVKMVDANIQREELLPSEKAFAYKMKMDAMRRQGERQDLTSRQFVEKLSSDELGETVGVSGRQIQRFIRLTELIPELLEYVDQKRIQFTVAVEISYIDQEVQKWLFEYIKLIVLAGFFYTAASTALLSIDTTDYQIEGRAGNFLAAEEKWIDGQHFFLMQSQQFGKNAAYVVLDSNGKEAAQDTTEGFTDEVVRQIRAYMERQNAAKETPERTSATPPLENWQKSYENGEYLRSAEMAEEQNYSMIDGRMNNMPPKALPMQRRKRKRRKGKLPLKGRESVLKRLREYQEQLSEGRGQAASRDTPELQERR